MLGNHYAFPLVSSEAPAASGIHVVTRANPLPDDAGFLSVEAVFRDNMVLRRVMDLPVWGVGKKGDQVAVEFVGVSKTTEVDETGKWMVKLGSFPAGGPHEMKITQGAASSTLKNIMVGEVCPSHHAPRDPIQ